MINLFISNEDMKYIWSVTRWHENLNVKQVLNGLQSLGTELTAPDWIEAS